MGKVNMNIKKKEKRGRGSEVDFHFLIVPDSRGMPARFRNFFPIEKILFLAEVIELYGCD